MEGLVSFMKLGEAARGVIVDREEAGRTVHGGAERQQWSSMVGGVPVVRA
jgi:hypothetical protein